MLFCQNKSGDMLLQEDLCKVSGEHKGQLNLPDDIACWGGYLPIY